MSQSSGAFIPLIHSQLAELKKLCGSIFHRPVRDSLVTAESYLQNIKPTDKLDLQAALAPFFTAIEDDHKLFQSTVLDCFYKIFRQSSHDLFPNRDLTCQIIQLLIKFDKVNSDELNLTCCNVCIACLRSPSGVHFCHGSLLRKMFRLLFRIYNNCENPNTFNSIKTSINETLLALFDTYNEPVSLAPAPSIGEFAGLATSIIFENSMSIRKYLGPIIEAHDYSPTIRDVDVFGVISLLSRIIELNKLKLRTINLATSFLIFALQQNSKFFERRAFRLLLETKIHVACLSLTLDNRIELAEPTAELFVTLWSRFAAMYTEGLNSVLVKGLQTTLTSPDQRVLTRSLTIYKKLAKYPQLFVDAFVNYDCDRSGFFDNVWENTLNLIVKLAYPDINRKSPVQVQAVDIVVDFVGALWEYFTAHKDDADNDEQHMKESTSNANLSKTSKNSNENDKNNEKGNNNDNKGKNDNNNNNSATQSPSKSRVNGNEKTDERPQEFFEAKKMKDVFSKGLALFKKGFKKGINFFIENKYCENTPSSIADFLWNNPALDSGEVGQLIGDKDRVEVLKCFTNHFDFRSMTFEQAFRQFLQKFQVPGEAQMIDRVMEQFGSKFYNDNPTLFSCADTVYVLAFSALMLHTDAFHPNVKSRMTLDQFLQNNKGIDNGNDMPIEFLTELYRGITSKQIYVSSSNDPSNRSRPISATNSALLTREQRADLYKSQCKLTLMEARNRSTTNSERQRVFHRSESPLFIGPMFQSIWGGTLAVLTMTFEQNDDPKIYQTCLKGLSFSVHIASHCFIESALDTLVDSFGTFTCLRKGLREAKKKNFECTNSLLKIALEDKNYLRGAWEIVMGELSALDHIKVSQNFNVEDMKDLFAKTPELDRESIVDFIRAVCQTSNQELAENPPRIFLLEQVRIVAVLNMKRPRYIWLPIWDIIGEYLKNISSSPSLDLAILGINTLMQIAKEFLDQPELTQFHFQRHFMLPFQQIFEKQTQNAVRDFTLENLKQIIINSGNNLQSGWSVAFELLTIASTDPLSQERAFQIISVLIKKYLGIISSVDLISVLSNFIAKAENVKLREEAVGFLGTVSKILSLTEENAWFTIFAALGQSGQNSEDSVRKQSHNVYLEILKSIDLPSNLLKNAIEESLPLFFEATEFTPHDESFFTSAIVFLKRLFSEIFDPNWTKYREFESPIYMKCLSFCAISMNKKLSKAALEVIQSEFQNLEDLSILIACLKEVASQVDKLSIPNARFFLTVVDGFNEIAAKDEMRFLEVIQTAIDICEAKKLYVIWAQSRSTSLKTMQKFTAKIPEEIAKCLMKTLSIFVECGFLKKNESDECLAWNQSVVVSLQMLNNMNKELFLRCFEESTDQLLTIISAYSSEVRKQISTAMQRKLL